MFVRRAPGRDGKVLSDDTEDGNDEVHRLYINEMEKKKAGVVT